MISSINATNGDFVKIFHCEGFSCGYEGTMRSGRRVGFGKEISKNGNLLRSGKFVDDILVKVIYGDPVTDETPKEDIFYSYKVKNYKKE